MHVMKRTGRPRAVTLTAIILTVACLLSPVTSLRVQAAPVTMSDGTVFDPEFYAQTYPDVYAAFGNDAEKLWQHYRTFGINEKRLPAAPGTYVPAATQASATFDPVFYANRYADLKAAFGYDAAKLWQHYRMYGEKEKRQAAANHVPGTAINAPSGTAQLPSSAASGNAKPASAATPAASASSVTFDPVFYANRYADLKAAFGYDTAKLWQHYRTYGEKEGRQAAANHVPGTKVAAPAGGAAQAAAPATPVFRGGGKRVAFIGDSISTFDGYIPSTYATYYPREGLQNVAETWWYKVSAGAGLQTVVNASWSGSCVSGARADTSGSVGSGQGRIRTVVAQNPNVIIILMGINDFQWDIKIDEFRECYRALVRQLREAMPNSLVVCCTCLPHFTGMTNGAGYTIEYYNSVIRQAAGEYGCYLIDTANCGLTRYQMIDQLHPNAAGATLVANYILSHLPQIK